MAIGLALYCNKTLNQQKYATVMLAAFYAQATSLQQAKFSGFANTLCIVWFDAE